MSVAVVSLQLEGLKSCPSSSEQLQHVASALVGALQDGLKGNRAVSCSVWSVITAATRAYPIQLSPSVEKAQAVADAWPDADLVQTWALQAAADGSFVVLLQKLATQPQILTAYARDATIRDAKAIEHLITLLQALQGLITVTPYEMYLQQQPAQTDVAYVHVQTESGAAHTGPLQQQQQQAPWQSSSSVSTKHHSCNSAGSNRNHQIEHAPSNAQMQQVAAPAKHQGLVRLFQRSKQDRAVSSGSNTSSEVAADALRRMQQTQQEHEQCALVHVQLQVPPCNEAAAGNPKQLVQLKLQVLSQDGSNTASEAARAARTSNTTASSSSRLLGAGTGAVKGMLHTLQQSASAGLQHGAAAGQELGGAVAAAGEAAFGAISQPFAAVKGLALRAGGGKQTGSKIMGAMTSRAAADTAGAAKEATILTGRGAPSFFSRRHTSSTAAAGAADGGPATPPDSRSQSFTAGLQTSPGAEPALQANLRTTADESNPVQLVIHVLPGMHKAGSCESTKVTNWKSTKALLGKIGVGHSSNKERDGGAHGSTARSAAAAAAGNQVQDGISAPCTAAAAGDKANGNDEDVLEGDMWSVMERLKHAAGGVASRHSTGTTRPNTHGGTPAAEAPTAAAAADLSMLEQQGQELLQQLLSCCSDVSIAAAALKGCLGDECTAAVQLVGLIKELLNHGLRNSPAPGAAFAGGSDKGSGASSRAAAAREALGGWLQSGKSTTAFGVLQALQQGSKQHPRLMLGADGIANMKAAKHSPAANKLDMWVRASLNEQLLGVRLSTLIVNPAALAAWYCPQALLLQQQAMQLLVQQFFQLCDHKFALLVGTAQADMLSSTHGGSADRSTSWSNSSVLPDHRKLFGGFNSFGLGMMPGFGSGAVAGTDGSNDAADAAAGSTGESTSSNIPTFLWSALGTGAAGSSGSADAGPTTTASAVGGGLFRRRRIPQIQEVRVPPPDSAAVLSPDASCALSPVSTAGDAAYAEWWSPNSSWQDFGNAEGLDGTAGGGGGGGAFSRSSSASGGFVGLTSGGAVFAEAVVERASPSEQQQYVSSRTWQQTRSSQALASDGSMQSEAALKVEQELAAAMSAPATHMLGVEKACRTGSSSGSSGGRAGSRNSGSRGSSSHGLHRSSSAGWDAAVARARSSRPASATHVGAGLGVMSNHQTHALTRRSRSPDALWPAAAPGRSIEAQLLDKPAAARRSVQGHIHKRSSSLNDLPELQALLDFSEVVHTS